MSASSLMQCSDEEFEATVDKMERSALLELVQDLISEMDAEQLRFDDLSKRLDKVRDQASSEFKNISNELIRSQNRLTLLMGRNVHCFNLTKTGKRNVEPKQMVTIIESTKPGLTGKRKVVKVTRTVTRKILPSNNNSGEVDPELQRVFNSQLKKLEGITDCDKEHQAAETLSRTHADSPNSLKLPIVEHLSMEQDTSCTKEIMNDKGTADSIPLPVTNIDELPLVSANSLPASETNTNEMIGTIDNRDRSAVPASIDDTGSISSDTDRSDTTSSSTAADVAFEFYPREFGSSKVKERIFMKSWNPTRLLEELYALTLAKEPPDTSQREVINMEGYIEHLPIGKKKTTLLKTWKRVYCRSKDGIIYFYRSKDQNLDSIAHFVLMGGVLEEMSNRMIGIDNKRGQYLMMRCPTDMEHRDWLRSLYTQTTCSPTTMYVRPSLTSRPHSSQVIIIDLGSCSVRAGILGATASYPQFFFPCLSSKDANDRNVFGFESYHPDYRVNGLNNPLAAGKHIDKYKVNVKVLEDLFLKIFTDLAVDHCDYTICLSTPHNSSRRLKEEVLRVLLSKLKVKAVNMINQSLLIPYVYNATSGIVVDIGERIDIVAITDGYLVDGGLVRRSYGGSRVTDTLNSCLMEYRLFTPVEHLITRLIKEKTCFVSMNYEEDVLDCMSDSTRHQATVNLANLSLPEGFHLRQVTLDDARFKAPEGLLRAELMGVDSPTLPKLIKQTILKCPMDTRREMWQSIFLGGGTTNTPGFPERLYQELKAIAPETVDVQVHASPHRYHAAYIGACMLARLPNFYQSCITREEWNKHGKNTLQKWKTLFQG